MVLCRGASGQGGFRDGGLADGRALVHANVAMQGNSKMGYADRLDYGQDYSAIDVVASRVLAVGVVGADVEIREVTRTRSAGQSEAREE